MYENFQLFFKNLATTWFCKIFLVFLLCLLFHDFAQIFSCNIHATLFGGEVARETNCFQNLSCFGSQTCSQISVYLCKQITWKRSVELWCTIKIQVQIKPSKMALTALTNGALLKICNGEEVESPIVQVFLCLVNYSSTHSH